MFIVEEIMESIMVLAVVAGLFGASMNESVLVVYVCFLVASLMFIIWLSFHNKTVDKMVNKV